MKFRTSKKRGPSQSTSNCVCKLYPDNNHEVFIWSNDDGTVEIELRNVALGESMCVRTEVLNPVSMTP